MKTTFYLYLLFLPLFSWVSGQENSGLAIPDNNVQTYNYPRISPQNKDIRVKAGGREIFVYQTSAGPFASFSVNGSTTIEIELPYESSSLSISPKKYGILPTVEGKTIRFEIPGPILLVLENGGMPELYIYANPIEKPLLNPGNKVKYFRSGQVYEVGELRLGDNETLYIEGGAVVRGCIRATSVQNVHIAGYGILDGSFYPKSDSRRSIVFEDCRESGIADIIIVEPSSWIIVLGICDDVKVTNVKELGSVASSDGADIVGSKNIKIENCMFRNGDDCIAIKSLDLRPHGSATLDFSRNVENVEIRGCSFLAYLGGQALEIGHELRTTSVKNIRFVDCDILGVHGFGGVFGIHNADRAIVSDILYENIRVEHHYSKLIDLKIIKSMWGRDAERGQIRNVIFRNIDVAISQYNPGYSVSLIGGFDANHTIENVKFDNFRLNGKLVNSADELDLYIKQAANISFNQP